MTAYYNEIDPYAAQWLRNLIAAGHIAPGDVDERSIVDVHPDDLKGYDQCHFFAGIGGWSLAARMAGWPDDRPIWTGSCPCQPFSVIGKHEGEEDERHLWPTFFALISARRPAVVMGEQVAAAVGKDWLDGVHSDLESIGYACGATVVPACSVDAPHRRDRLWFVADAARDNEWRDGEPVSGDRSQIPTGGLRHACPACGGSGRCGPYWPGGLSTICGNCNVDHAVSEGLERQRRDGHDRGKSRRIETEPFGSASQASGTLPDPKGQPGRAGLRQDGQIINGAFATDGRRNSTAWYGAEWAIGADGKARRVEPGIRLLAHGVPARVGKLRAYGNAIVPQVAAEVIGAYLDVGRIAG